MLFNFKKYTANNPLLREDGDNVTAADNAAYGADQEQVNQIIKIGCVYLM